MRSVRKKVRELCENVSMCYIFVLILLTFIDFFFSDVRRARGNL